MGTRFQLPLDGLLILTAAQSSLPEAGQRRIVGTMAHTQNPPWTRKELILALELYMTNPASPPGKTSTAIIALSRLLGLMATLAGTAGNDRFRNPNGVYLKMMNLRALDPAFTAVGKVGMSSGGALEKQIWDEYAGNRSRLQADAASIRAAVKSFNLVATSTTPPATEPYVGEEGGVIVRLHKRYERDRKLIARKKEAAIVAGSLACEACGFDFEQRYGDHGAGFVEVHHLRPAHQMTAPGKVTLDDLALFCSNCHRMAHRRREPLTLDELKQLL